MRQRCEALVRELRIPDPFTVSEFCDSLGESRGRRIHLVPHNLDAEGPSGLWVGTSSVDYIFYQKDTSPLHRVHIILHEVGHILCDHDAQPSAGLTNLVGGADDKLVRRLLARAHGSSGEEREAEFIAYLIYSRISSAERGHAEPRTGSDNGDLKRIEDTLR